MSDYEKEVINEGVENKTPFLIQIEKLKTLSLENRRLKKEVEMLRRQRDFHIVLNDHKCKSAMFIKNSDTEISEAVKGVI